MFEAKCNEPYIIVFVKEHSIGIKKYIQAVPLKIRKFVSIYEMKSNWYFCQIRKIEDHLNIVP